MEEQEKRTWFEQKKEEAIEKPWLWKLVLRSEIRNAKRNREIDPGEKFRSDYAEILKKTKVKENYILYEAFGGRGMICNPHAIFKYLLRQEDFKDFVHIWVLENFEENRGVIEFYKNYENVKFVEYQSREYCEAIATCKYLINNVSFMGYFTKRPEQIYINTWHGIHFKSVGFDIPGGNVSAGNTMRNFLAADYILSPNRYTTEIDRSAFKLDYLFEGKILEEGQPRNDSFFHTPKEDILKKLRDAGVSIDPDKKLILYAPTWKGEKYQDPDTDLEKYFRVLDTLQKHVDAGKYQVLVKPHQIVYYHIREKQKLTGSFIPATIDTNELLSITDVLISDYSSIYFDFLVSGKPILFFTEDLVEEEEGRGLYFGVDRLPGPVTDDLERLGELAADPDRAMEPFQKIYQREAAWACAKEDGKVCERIVDVIFRGKASEAEVTCNAGKKSRILLFAGDMRYKEQALSMKILAKRLNYEKFDFTLLAPGKTEGAKKRISNSFPKELRVLFRNRPFNATLQEIVQHEMWMRQENKLAVLPDEFYDREAMRLFGMAKFDQIVDFTGKVNLYSEIFKHMHVKKIHNYPKIFEKGKAADKLYLKFEAMLNKSINKN